MITIEGLVYLSLCLVAGRMASSGLTGNFFSFMKDHILNWSLSPMGFIFDLIGIIVFLLSTWLAWRGWKSISKRRFFTVAAVFLAVSMMLYLLIIRTTYGQLYGSHDGVVQTEIAAGMILDGKNPYVETYQDTLFENFYPTRIGQTISPVLSHYPYLPLVPLATLPMAAIARVLHIFADGRLVTMGAYLLLAWVLIREIRDERKKTWAAIILFANPLFLIYPFTGHNDILFVAPLIGAALAAKRHRWAMAGIFLGLALAAKQTAWLVLPLWLIFLWRLDAQRAVPRVVLGRSILATAVTVAVIILPFVIWNGPAFYDDTIRFVSGAVPHTYPIGGDSLWQFRVMSGAADSWAAFSTWPYVGGMAILATALTAWWIFRRPSVRQWLTSSVVAIILVSLVNRFFYENYVTSLLLLAAATLVLPPAEDGQSEIALGTGAR